MAEYEKTTGVNSEDSLLVIYILRILKKYSSADNPLSSQDVMEHLKEDYSIGRADKSNAQQKKIRRHMDTLHDFYGKGCIRKVEGKSTREGHKWYYDPTKDEFAGEDAQIRETLSEDELEFIIDLITTTKLLNSAGTIGIVDKLLKKTTLSSDDRKRRLRSIEREGWVRCLNDELVSKKKAIEKARDDECRIRFDYEDFKSIIASPCDVLFQDDEYIMAAKVGSEYRPFLLKKIHNLEIADNLYDFDDEFFDKFEDSGERDYTKLDILFSNIRFIKEAISNKQGLQFQYLSYAIGNAGVVFVGKDKTVLPHSLVFNDGKYYLIGIDENFDDNNAQNVGYYRVDLIKKLDYSSTKLNSTDWNARVVERVQRAREVEKHPLMQAGEEIRVEFLVVESALDRVIDAFGKGAKFQTTKETKAVLKDAPIKKWNDETADKDAPREKLVKVFVRTTRDEAFRWALANADVAELVSPADIRYRLRRIADPMKRTYVKTMADKVRRNVDWICETGTFNFTPVVGEQPIGEELAYESFKLLDKEGNNGVVNDIAIWNVDVEEADFLGNFKNVVWLDIKNSTVKDTAWISQLTELLGLSIVSTSIDSVPWLEKTLKLQGIELQESPISDLSVLSEHKDIFQLIINEIKITDISFIEKYECLQHLVLIGCPINDYSPLLRIPPLNHLEVDEKAVAALGMDNLVKHHPNAEIIVRQKIKQQKS